MYKKKKQKYVNGKVTKRNKDGNGDAFSKPIKERNLYTTSSTRTEFLFYKPGWMYKPSESTVEAVIKNEANGYMKPYFVSSSEHNGYNEGVVTFYTPEGPSDTFLPLIKPNCGIISSQSYRRSSNFETMLAESCNGNSDDRGELLEKYIQQVQMSVDNSPENSPNNSIFDESKFKIDLNRYYREFSTLFSSVGSEYTTTGSSKTIHLLSQSTQTDPLVIKIERLRHNRATQTDMSRASKRMPRSHFHNRAVQCNNFGSTNDDSLLSNVVKYGRFILLAVIVINVVKTSCMNRVT